MTLSCPSSEPRTILCLIAAVVALVAVSSMTVRAQTGTAMLDALSGVWEGRGTMRRSPTAAAEPVSCRFEGTLAAGGLSLALNYVCLGIDLRFDATGALSFDPGSERYSATLTTTAANRRAVGSGTATGATINLDLTTRHPETGAQLASRLTIAVAGARQLVKTLRSTDAQSGTSFQAFRATFGR